MDSPLKLFRSLKHGDPQAVAFTAVAVFLVSVCWFSWTLLAPKTEELLPLGGGRVRRTSPAETASLQEILEQQRVFLTPEDVPNPFFRLPPPQRNPRTPTGNDSNEEPPPTTTNPRVIPNRPTPPKPENVKPSTRPLTLTFKGSLTRPDRNTVALISIMETGSQTFVKIGDKLDVFTLNEISSDGIQLQQENGPVILLPRGQTQRFEVPL